MHVTYYFIIWMAPNIERKKVNYFFLQHIKMIHDDSFAVALEEGI